MSSKETIKIVGGNNLYISGDNQLTVDELLKLKLNAYIVERNNEC